MQHNSETNVVILADDEVRLRLTLESLECNVGSQHGSVRIVFSPTQHSPEELEKIVSEAWPSIDWAEVALAPAQGSMSVQGDGALYAVHGLSAGTASSSFAIVFPPGGLLRSSLHLLYDEEDRTVAGCEQFHAESIQQEAKALLASCPIGEQENLSNAITAFRVREETEGIFVFGGPFIVSVPVVCEIKAPLRQEATLQGSYYAKLLLENRLDQFHTMDSLTVADGMVMLVPADVFAWRPRLDMHAPFSHVGPKGTAPELLREMARDPQTATDWQARARTVNCICDARHLSPSEVISVLESFRYQTYASKHLDLYVSSVEIANMASGASRVHTHVRAPPTQDPDWTLRWPTEDHAYLHPCTLSMFAQGTEGDTLLRTSVAVNPNTGSCVFVPCELTMTKPGSDVHELRDMPELLQLQRTDVAEVNPIVQDVRIARVVTQRVLAGAEFNENGHARFVEAASTAEHSATRNSKNSRPNPIFVGSVVGMTVAMLFGLAAVNVFMSK
jgi:hypothetical protein